MTEAQLVVLYVLIKIENNIHLSGCDKCESHHHNYNRVVPDKPYAATYFTTAQPKPMMTTNRTPQGESGTLDYILGSPAIESQRAGDVIHYHANADETSALE